MEFYKHDQYCSCCYVIKSARETAKKVLLSVIWNLLLIEIYLFQIRILKIKREKIRAMCPYLLVYYVLRCLSMYFQNVSVVMRGETIRAIWTFSHKKTMVKGIPIIGPEGPRGMWMQGCTYLCIHSHGTRKKSRMAIPTLGRLYPVLII